MRHIFFLSSLLLLSCSPEKGKAENPVFTESDSTRCVAVLLDSLKEEMLAQTYYHYSQSAISCCFQPRYFHKIRINARDEIMQGSEIRDDSIVWYVKRLYAANMYHNDPANNSPMYSSITVEGVKTNMANAEAEYKAVLNDTTVSADIVHFKARQVEEWRKKLEVLKTIKRDTLREPLRGASVDFDYVNKNKKYEAVLDSILMGFYALREIRAQEYFKDSYAHLYWLREQTKDKTTLLRLNALKTLHPVGIRDVPYLREKYPVEGPPTIN